MTGTGENSPDSRLSRKAVAFGLALLVALITDLVTKRLAVQELSPAHLPHEVLGDYVRFTLAYNPDAAMGLSLGSFSRVGFTVTAIIVLGVLAVLYRRTPANARVPGMALGLITGGALGNLTDRITSSLGVVDFIDVGLGDSRFWTFNVADASIFCGALLMVLRPVSSPQPADASSPDRVETSFSRDHHRTRTAHRSASPPGDTE